ncbi:large conductance mechanosensitive channel protein MscL [Metabacillus idriensis]|jgi:large conductance mechanosensitive channel|uniref:Large-conductance mechanosensitive channel n=1 Tax=Metabacillus idriensis TaxID=324768 RepID=A0A6I2MD88_9BACI|nr:large conductance mechanosensitive channel protein MscL [Metabacillus idriensis]MCM3598543.1 large conductance mechanosensitive channel protein MscL [Metabacillus idriensis]MDR0138735.1 large conductance mechanosensitive channel protein MscL [Metabacillus idriensis]MRX54381.1 large conductance mechanosensitive channel protein MscL [Metabacillus idriensis]OHR68257.1 mechanosensitive ion channel protein MscL [Bacillus sp. HMSC76G11]
MLKEFKKFAIKGNVIDLAVGVIIGTAFGKIVTSLVNDIVMPLFGVLLGGVDFSKLQYPFGDAIIKYGAFLQTVLDFFIIAFSVFLFIRFFERFKRKDEQKPVPTLTNEEKLLTEIRDLLKKDVQQEREF